MKYKQYLLDGGIHIKKSHKGKFTDYCGGKVTEECIARGKRSPSAAVRKQATFALNARSWHHKDGGIIKLFAKGSTIYNANTNNEDVSYNELAGINTPDYNPLTENSRSTFRNPQTKSGNPWEEEASKYDVSTPDVSTDLTASQSTSSSTSYALTGVKKIHYDFKTKGSKSLGAASYNKLDDSMKYLIDLMEEEGIPIKITSGFRNSGQAGKAGNKSWHTHGKALDIVPLNGDFNDLKNRLLSSPRIMAYMRDKGIGILEEITPDIMRKTGASGKHFHIGYDKSAVQMLNLRIQEFGATIPLTIRNKGLVTLTINGRNHTGVLTDASGKVVFQAGVAVGKAGVGRKTREGDNVTPEGDFTITKDEDASSWSHDFNDGKGTIKGAYGPRFLGLSAGNGIGIHGTHDPGSIGTNASEGCIRFNNNDLVKLYSLLLQYGMQNVHVKITNAKEGGTILYAKSGTVIDEDIEPVFESEINNTNVNKNPLTGLESDNPEMLIDDNIEIHTPSQSSESDPWEEEASKYDTTSSSTSSTSTTTSDSSNSHSEEYQGKSVGDGDQMTFRDILYNELSKLGFNGDTAKIMVALMGLETGSGKKVVGDYNFGNITKGSWTGRTATVGDNTNEFRVYDNLNLGISDYVKLCTLTYDILPGDSKDTVISKLSGNNHRHAKWCVSQRYKNLLSAMYKTYWG